MHTAGAPFHGALLALRFQAHLRSRHYLDSSARCSGQLVGRQLTIARAPKAGRQQAGAPAFLCHLATSQLYLLVFGWLPETLGVNFYRAQSVRFLMRHLCTVYVVFTSCHFVLTILQ